MRDLFPASEPRRQRLLQNRFHVENQRQAGIFFALVEASEAGHQCTAADFSADTTLPLKAHNLLYLFDREPLYGTLVLGDKQDIARRWLAAHYRGQSMTGMICPRMFATPRTCLGDPGIGVITGMINASRTLKTLMPNTSRVPELRSFPRRKISNSNFSSRLT